MTYKRKQDRYARPSQTALEERERIVQIIEDHAEQMQSSDRTRGMSDEVRQRLHYAATTLRVVAEFVRTGAPSWAGAWPTGVDKP